MAAFLFGFGERPVKSETDFRSLGEGLIGGGFMSYVGGSGRKEPGNTATGISGGECDGSSRIEMSFSECTRRNGRGSILLGGSSCNSF